MTSISDRWECKLTVVSLPLKPVDTGLSACIGNQITETQRFRNVRHGVQAQKQLIDIGNDNQYQKMNAIMRRLRAAPDTGCGSSLPKCS